MAEDFELKKDASKESISTETTKNGEEGKYNWSSIFVSSCVVLALIAVGGYMFMKSPKSTALKDYILETNVEEVVSEETSQKIANETTTDEMTRKHSIYEDKGITNLEEAVQEQEKYISKERKHKGKIKNKK